MDKFDRDIANAKQSYEPKINFVEETMAHVKTEKMHRRWSPRIWAPTLVGAAAVVAIVFIALPKLADNSSQSSTTSPSTTQTSQSTAPLAAGTDNSSLDHDLNSIQSSMDQAGSDQTGAQNAVNDDQQQITVPTD